ncbi:Crp/Fnr family transcriptional regulator [Bacillus carboniphilus]|uniref:Crp/Fnr family transcriptional regulator n=1 Tax=Bacillus carboniphilus TaxID=86663 RepID=A0ABP3FSM5_9BACI
MLNVLKDVPLFNGLNEEDLHLIAQITSKRKYKKKANVFMEGETREAVFFIESGVVKSYKVDEDGNEQVISILQSGDMFPHVGFFDESPYPATVEVVREAELLVIRIDDFDQLIIRQPQMAVKVMKVMGQKILHLQQRLQDFISKDVQHRLTHSLVRLAREYGEVRKQGTYVSLPITNQDFANMVGTSRESINRIINHFKREKLMDSDRHGFLIYDIDKLESYH